MFLIGVHFEIVILVILGSYFYLLSFGCSSGGLLYSYVTEFMPSIGISIAGLS